MGFVDLHDHILYGIDDGCETPAETLEAVRLLADLGFEAAAPSPHAAPHLPSWSAAVCEARRADVAALLAREGIAFPLHAGAENRLDEELIARAAGPERRGIGATGRWALVEAPFMGALPDLPGLVTRLIGLGVRPLVAHPERCAEFERPERAAEVVRLGGALQLNVGALAGAYGPGARARAERILGDGLYAVAATDLHAPAGARRWLEGGLAALEKRAGNDALQRLCAGNPRKILAGEELS